MSTQVRLIRVFVSSPGDVRAERELLEAAIADVNRTDGRRSGVVLQSFRWERDVVPQVGPQPQQVVDEQTPACDIYVGIMAARFGTPTDGFGSGTEKEFCDAVKNWAQHGRPWILFYFHSKPPLPETEEDAIQYAQVLRFRRGLQGRGITCQYHDASDGENSFLYLVTRHLRELVNRLAPTAPSILETPDADGVPDIPDTYWEWLQSNCGEIELLGLRVKHGQGVKLNQVYTPLTTGGSLLMDLLGRESLYLSGDPGSGKSTFCRWVAWLVCEGMMPAADVEPPNKFRETFPKSFRGRLPVLVPLRDFYQYLPRTPGARTMTATQLEESLAAWLEARDGGGLRWPCLQAQLKQGKTLLLLDGVDEVPPLLGSEPGQWYPREMLLDGLAAAIHHWEEPNRRKARDKRKEAEGPMKRASELKAEADRLKKEAESLRETTQKLDGRTKEAQELEEEAKGLEEKADGLAEEAVGPRKKAEELTKQAGELDEARNRVLVTSRPAGLNEEQRRRLRLTPAPLAGLAAELQELLVYRWFCRLREDRERGRNAAGEMLGHLRAQRGLDELAANPLLLSSMCIIYDEGKRLPQDEYELYDRIVDTVLHKRYPPVKERVSVIRGRLGAVALGMHTGGGPDGTRVSPEPVASDAQLDLYLQAYRQQDGATEQGWTSMVQVREDLLTQTGLLVERNDNRAAFYHLSFQEFLAADRLFVLLGRTPEVLRDLMLQRGRSATWRNTLSFLFGCWITKFNLQAGFELLEQMIPMIVVREEADDHLVLLMLDYIEILHGRVFSGGTQTLVEGQMLDGPRAIIGGAEAIPSRLGKTLAGLIESVLEKEIPVSRRHALATAWGRLGDPRIVTDLRLGPEPQSHPAYAFIPAGRYCYGERKVASIIAQPFLLSRYLVTNGQYAVFMAEGGYRDQQLWSDDGRRWLQESKVTEPRLWLDATWNSPNQPVTGVSFWEAEAFAKWAGGSLPTERQWEAAARGPEGYVYPWGDEWEDGICNTLEAKLGTTSPVGLFPRSRSAAFGLEDLAGNVWEWCADFYDRKSYRSVRVVRGGSWASDRDNTRSGFRSGRQPDERKGALGFRVCCGVLPGVNLDP